MKAIAIRTETSKDGLCTEREDYQEKELEMAVDTPERNRRVVEAYIDYALGRRAICFAVTVEHACHLATAFTTASIPAAVVSGETPLVERKRLYQALRDGSLKALTNALVHSTFPLSNASSWPGPPNPARSLFSVLVEGFAWRPRNGIV